jgi:hypothetical protein
MGAIDLSLIALAIVLGGVLIGVVLRRTLPEHYLSEPTKDVSGNDRLAGL